MDMVKRAIRSPFINHVANPRGLHLPPLGRKDWRPPAGYTTHISKKGSRRLSSSRRSTHGPSKTTFPRTAWPRSDAEWKAEAEIFLQAGEAAGITFQWTETCPAGLVVVSVAEGSVAAKHGGVVSGMMLIEINRQRTADMSQDQTMQAMQAVTSQPRVLTLARRFPSPRTAQREPSEEGRPETSTPSSTDGSLTPDSRSTTSDVTSEARQTRSASSWPSSRESSASSRAHSALSSYDVDTSSFSAAVSVPVASADVLGSKNSATTQSRHRNARQRTLALRFVGSRGDISLFDRDHILGLKKRDIEFIAGGSSSEAHEAHKANSHRSLGELTRDWRNDPFSTPARRRRLINDACKVIVTSYTQASALRVMELRKQEAAVVRIQAVARMWSAQRRFVAKLGERRGVAAFAIQLVWLSYKARRRLSILREERDHARRVDETKRKKRLVAEKKEKRRREEERRREEADALEQERRWREQQAVILVQRRVRENQEHRKTTKKVQRLLGQKQAAQDKQAAMVIQIAFRRSAESRRHSQRVAKHSLQNRASAASALLQQAWRRHRTTVLGARESLESQAPLPSRSTVPNGNQPQSLYHKTHGQLESAHTSHSRLLGDQLDIVNASSVLKVGRYGGESTGGAVSWEGWQVANPFLADETTREVPEEAADVTGVDARPQTTAGAMESALSPPAVEPPPAGMMTVRVRIGSEETQFVTPIVLTESNHPTDEATARAESEYSLEKKGGQEPGGGLSGRSGAGGTEVGVQSISVGSAGGVQQAPFQGHESIPRRSQGGEGEAAAVKVTAVAPATEISHEQKDNSDRGGVNAPLPPAMIVGDSTNSLLPRNAQNVVVAPHFPTTAAVGGKRYTPVEVACTGKPTQEGLASVIPRTEYVPEQFIMEDSQVYLGCAICGVKYLVEAVDPRLPDSTQGQPTPEVIYLCTTCGGTLRAGEDGRWRRRRRPSSAPAAGHRNAMFDGGRKWLPERRKGSANATAGGNFEGGTPSPRGIKLGRCAHRDESTARLKDARCARRIQHVYRDFRHRQYLQDWASSRLHRWFLARAEDRRRSRRNRSFHSAATAIQSAARAASARARCSALRDARLRYWVDKAAAVWDADEASPSPVAVELLREMNTPLPPPPTEARPQKASGGGGRAMAEALAPTMGRPPPGCPGALDVNWGERGVKLELVFPPEDTPPLC